MVLDLQLPAAPGDQVYKAAKEIDPDQESPRPEEEGILATSPRDWFRV
jgi:hypothetical protein